MRAHSTVSPCNHWMTDRKDGTRWRENKTWVSDTWRRRRQPLGLHTSDQKHNSTHVTPCNSAVLSRADLREMMKQLIALILTRNRTYRTRWVSLFSCWLRSDRIQREKISCHNIWKCGIHMRKWFKRHRRSPWQLTRHLQRTWQRTVHLCEGLR